MSTYIVGLPCAVTLEDDGTVTVAVDLTEVSSAMLEDESHDYATARGHSEMADDAIRAGRVTVRRMGGE